MTRLHERTLVVGVAVLAVAALALPGTAGTLGGPADVQEADAPRFLDAPYSEHRGDVVRIPVALPNGSTATVTVEGNDTDVAATIALHDGSGDGRVTLLWNTYLAGSGSPNPTLRASAAADSVTTRPGGPLPVGEYALAVRPDDGNGTDRATLRLTPPAPVELSVLRAAPGAVDALATPRDVVAAKETVALSRARTDDEGHLLVGIEEVTVLALRAPGLSGAFAAADGPNATARLRSLLGSQLSVRVVEDLGTVHAHEDQSVYDLRNATWLQTVPDPANDTYFLALGSPEAVHAGGPVESGGPDIDVLDRFRFQLTVGGGREAAAVDNVTVQFVEVGGVELLTTDHGRLVPRTANGTIVGRTTLRSAERVTVRLERSSGSPFPLQRRVEVAPDGRFRARFDFDGIPPGTTFEAVVRYENRTVDTAPGIVGPAAIVRFTDRTVFPRHVEDLAVDSVFTTDGGFVVLHLGSADGPVVGVSDHFWAGNHSNVEVPLQRSLDGNVTLVAVAYRDRHRHRRFDPSDAPYGAGASADASRLVDIDDEATPTPSPTPTATRTRTETPPGHDDVPGFGTVVAVVALAAAIVGVRAERSRPGVGTRDS